MTKIQSVDKKASLLFVGDVNAQHEQWLGSSTMSVHDRAVLDIASSSGCEQMVTEPTHIDGGMFDLALTDIYALEVRVGSPVGASDHSAIFMDAVL